MPEPTLDARQKRALAAALLACPSMADRAGRDAIIRELPADIRHSITRSDAGLLDVTNTINAALNYPRGLATLIDLVRVFEGDSLPMSEVERLLAELQRAAPAVAPPVPTVGPSGDRWVLETPVRMEFVRIPAGEFLMGSDPDLDHLAAINEQPQHHVCLPEYYIGLYPVTVSQYAVFAQATCREAPGPQGRPDYPVINVSWREALTFCRWLSQRSGLPVRLPSEAEWEKAARGTDGRTYPWGDVTPVAALFVVNCFETGPHRLSAICSDPQVASPYGVLDMAGNVWEWTASLLERYPYREDDRRNDAATKGDRVIRGGSWRDLLWFARCASRRSADPGYFSYNVGFRVVVSLISSGF